MSLDNSKKQICPIKPLFRQDSDDLTERLMYTVFLIFDLLCILICIFVCSFISLYVFMGIYAPF